MLYNKFDFIFDKYYADGEMLNVLKNYCFEVKFILPIVFINELLDTAMKFV